jgi:hypothetical protein
VNGTARVSGNATISLNQNAATQINISNTTSGSSASPILNLTSDVASGIFQFGKQSTLTNVYKTIGVKDGFIYNGSTGGDISILNDFATGRIKFAAGGVSTAQATLFSTGNFAINTTTDNGYKLDVNGTARISGNINSISTGLLTHSFFGGTGYYALIGTSSSNGQYAEIYRPTSTKTLSINNGDFDLNLGVKFNYTGLFGILIKGTTGNVLINTTTDAGYKLDVNGTARVSGVLTCGNNVTAANFIGNIRSDLFLTSNGGFYIFQSSGATGNAKFNQFVSIGTNNEPVASAALDVVSTTKGFLKPRLTTTQKNAIASPAAGLEVYDTTLNRPCFYDGTTWITL